MVGVAMVIAVIGQDRPLDDLDYHPWDVNRLDNGSLRVLGITLGKTTVQEANQIYASFAKTRLQDLSSASDTHNHQLIAIYDELSIGGLIAKLQLSYQLDAKTLRNIFKSAKSPENNSSAKGQVVLHEIDKKDEISLLNTPISSITYIPSIDFGEELIRQRFGQAIEELVINDEKQLWFYPDLGLQIYIYSNEPDRFVFSPLK